MTPYPYECPVHGDFIHDAPFGEAPRSVAHECGLDSSRIFATTNIFFTYGKDQFHGPTLGERIEKQYADCAADGRKIEPVGSRWV